MSDGRGLSISVRKDLRRNPLRQGQSVTIQVQPGEPSQLPAAAKNCLQVHFADAASLWVEQISIGDQPLYQTPWNVPATALLPLSSSNPTGCLPMTVAWGKEALRVTVKNVSPDPIPILQCNILCEVLPDELAPLDKLTRAADPDPEPSPLIQTGW